MASGTARSCRPRVAGGIEDASDEDYCTWSSSDKSCSAKEESRRLKSNVPAYAQGNVLPTPREAAVMAKYLRVRTEKNADATASAQTGAYPSPASTSFRKLRPPGGMPGTDDGPPSGGAPSDDGPPSGGGDDDGGAISISSDSSTSYTDCSITSSGDYCLLSGMSKMYSAQSMEERLCAQCTSCGQYIFANQVQLPTELMLTSSSEAQETINSYVKTFKQKFQCCNCNLIGSGETCLPSETEWSIGIITSTCDRISMLRTSQLRPKFRWYELRAIH